MRLQRRPKEGFQPGKLLNYTRAAKWGFIYSSKYGLQLIRKGDFLLMARTGCVWKITPEQRKQNYRYRK